MAAGLRGAWARVGLRARLEAFILLSLLPLVALVVIQFLQERGREIDRARQSTLRLAELGAARQAEVVQQARGALQMLALVPEVRMALPEECQALLRQAAALHPWSTGFSVVHPDGTFLCDSQDRAVNIADRTYFQRAMATRSFTLSDYLVGRRKGRPVLMAVLPTVNDVGKVDRLLMAGIDLQWLAELSAEVARGVGGVVTLLDAQGTVLARAPDPQAVDGRALADRPHIREILDKPAGVVEGAGADGRTRIIGFAPLGEAGARIAVWVARDAAVAEVDRRLLLSTGVMAGVVLVLVVGVWFLMEVLVLRGLRHLQASAAHLSSGPLDPLHPCLPAPIRSDEFGAVAHTFRTMGRTLRTLAFEDRLTGLANRRFLDAYMERHREAGSGDAALAVLYLDLDGFKPVNDRHGHPVGDAVLGEVGVRLTRCVRDGDLAARIGGDEFAVVLALGDGATPRRALEVAGRIIDSLAAPIPVNGMEIRIGCSVGIALWPMDHGDLAGVLRLADQALYAAKRAGRGRARLYAELGVDCGRPDGAGGPP